MKRIFVLCLALCGFAGLRAQPQVPEKVTFCEMELTLNPAARKYIGEVIAGLKPGSGWFNALAERAAIYFPHVEEAFALAGVPDDLKYIVLQESALRGDAVSSSNAVGFWQFKEPAAREVGLVMDRHIDERRHIYRASLGAARYFFRINRDFDNWVYAVIGYNRGPAGAIPFTDEKMYGRREMVLTGNTHWYALKAIAYKLAFEEAVAAARPTSRLEPVPTRGETSVSRLARDNGMETDELRRHNPWILGDQLPGGQEFTVYVPREGAPVLAHNRPNLNVKQVGEGDNVGGTRPAVKRDTRRFTYLDPFKDPDYGLEYVRAEEGQTMVEIAVRFGTKAKKLAAWNGFDLGHRLKTGEVVYLKPAKRSKFHIVEAGENLQKIAARHETSPEKIHAHNRMKNEQVFAGQKLYLKGKKPKREKPILLEDPWTREAAQEEPNPAPKTETKPPVKKTTPPAVVKTESPGSGKTITHTVQAGETLWRISQKYGVSVEDIRKQNRMSGNNIYVGQQLRIAR